MTDETSIDTNEAPFETEQVPAAVEHLDTSTMTMDQLVAAYNGIAAEYDIAPVETFKTLKAGRAEIAELEQRLANLNAGSPEEPTAKSEHKGGGPRQGVGAFAKECIAAGMSNKDALEATLAKFPTAKTTYNCIAYYRNAMVKAAKAKATPVVEDTVPSTEGETEEAAA